MSKSQRPVRYLDDAMLFSNTKAEHFNHSGWFDVVKKPKKLISRKPYGLNIILNFSFVFGLPLPQSILKANTKDINLIEKLWCYFFMIIKTVLFAITMIHGYQLIQNKSICLSFYGVVLSGNLSTLLIFLKRKKLYNALQNVCHLASVLSPDISIGRDIKFQIIVFGIGITSLSACLSVFFFCEAFRVFLILLYIPPFIPQESADKYLVFVLTSLLCAFVLSVVTSGFVYLICRNTCTVLGDIVHIYTLKLKNRESWNVEALSDDISVFKNITLRVHEIDEALGIFVLLLYSTMMCGFFNTVSVLIQNDPKLKSPALMTYVGWTCVSATGTFFEMSRYGSYLADKVQCLKRQMLVSSDKFIRSSPPRSSMDVFNYLFEIVMKSQIEVTGNGMFVINYTLVLTIISTLITYSVLILQLDNGSVPFGPEEQAG